MLLVASWLLVASAPGAASEFKPWGIETAPVLALDQLDGPGIALAELRSSPVIVHFFATWCAPCIEEMASLNALAVRGTSSPAILAVNVGEVDARVRSFFRDRPVSFPILLDRDRATMKAWKVESLPTSFVLDRDLKPALKTEEPLDWTSPAVAAALAALPSTQSRSKQRGEETSQ
ncbi:TlpA disulfide reductase family protein [Bosea sp. NPDC055332]